MNYLTVLAIDDYDHNPFSKKIRKQIQDSSLDIHEYPKEKEYSPHAIYKKSNPVIFIQDISKAKKGTHSSLNNHCGSAFPKLISPMKQRCAKPFRELSIRYDGNIAICCNDWIGIFKCGNILDNNFEELWNNRFFNAARKVLYNGKRNFIPCGWCNAKSYRVGFLPDKKGKLNLLKPSPATYGIIKKAINGKPYTIPIHGEEKNGILSFT
jgi:MoaA/NifB/PqqE/SkfB family radical SAM enzyme